MTENPVVPRVLVAEDESLIRLMAVELLEDAGCAVVEAVDGDAALEKLKQDSQIQLLISDIRMPGLGGYELVDAGLTLRPELKVLLMTGYTQEPVPKHLVSRGVAVIYKPFDLDAFVAMAMGMLPAR
jgi:CheY-like chemotaxis protein